MASYNGASALFLVAAVLFAASSIPPTHGQSLSLAGLTVNGSLCCTPTGNCPGQGVSGVPVRLNCTLLGAGATVLGNGTTNANGTFNITIPRVTGLILGQSMLPCVVTVQLPLSTVVCPVLNATTGILASTVQSTGTVLSSLFGLIQRATVGGFFNVGA